jgi:hypothetical protein
MHIALFVISWAIIFAGNIASFQSGKKTEMGTGHDVGHALVPRLDVPPFVLNVAVTLAFMPLILNPVQGAFTTFVTYYTIVMLIRAVTTNLTVLPEDERCPHTTFTLGTLIQGHCSDMLFSGHQALVATLGIVCVQYGIVSGTIAISYNAIVAYLLLASRSHYTADIFLGAILPYLLILNKT